MGANVGPEALQEFSVEGMQLLLRGGAGSAQQQPTIFGKPRSYFSSGAGCPATKKMLQFTRLTSTKHVAKVELARRRSEGLFLFPIPALRLGGIGAPPVASPPPSGSPSDRPNVLLAVSRAELLTVGDAQCHVLGDSLSAFRAVDLVVVDSLVDLETREGSVF